MEWNLTGIPRTAHFYWGGGKLPYLRYLTIATFRYYNPDWEIFLWEPMTQYRDNTWLTHEQEYADHYEDYRGMVSKHDVVNVIIDFELLGFRNDASEVHKSDFLRWRLLSGTGGVWIDMDILFIKPMNSLYFNTEENKDVNTVFCIEPSKHYHSIGFLMGSEGNRYFDKIAGVSLKEYKKEAYQCMGSEVLNKMFPTTESARIEGVKPHNLAMDVVYAYNCSHVRELLVPVAPMKLTRNSIGIHWYAGHKLAGEYLNRTNGGLNPDNDGVLNKEIKKFRLLNGE